jgi:hypothetical protein
LKKEGGAPERSAARVLSPVSGAADRCTQACAQAATDESTDRAEKGPQHATEEAANAGAVGGIAMPLPIRTALKAVDNLAGDTGASRSAEIAILM